MKKKVSIAYPVFHYLLFILTATSTIPNSLVAQTMRFDATGTVDTFVVPDCVTAIEMEVRGGDGGSSSDEVGGAGQLITATFLVNPGDTLTVVAGVVGDGEGGSIASGGGGGSGVFNHSTNTLLVIAGGGGGSSGETGGGKGKTSNSVSTTVVASCGGLFDLDGCGGSTFDPSMMDKGGGGGGGFLGAGGGVSGLGGEDGFGASGGLGAFSSFNGGHGVGGGGGSSDECSGGGGGGGYTGGKGGSSIAGIDGGGSGGEGFVNGVPFTSPTASMGTATGQNGWVIFRYTIGDTPMVTATSTVTGSTNLDASFFASSSGALVDSWSWTGPNGFTSSLEDPTINPAVAGIYTIVVTDENRCTATASTTVALTDIEPVPEARVTNIPTMSEWGLLIYGLLILNIGVLFLGGLRRIEEMTD